MKRTALARKTPLARGPFARKHPEPSTDKRWPKQHRDEIPLRNQQSVKLRADYRCEGCGDDLFHRAGGELHHRVPKGMGGRSHPERHSPANLLFLCHSCHRNVTENPRAAYGFGRLVHRWLDPAHQNVLIHGRGWCLLDHHGNYVQAPE